MITSARNSHPHDSISPHTRHKENEFRVPAKQKYKHGWDTTASKDEATHRFSSSPCNVPKHPFPSSISTSSTCNSTTRTNESSSRSRRGSTPTTEAQQSSCTTTEMSVSVLPETSLTKSHVATKFHVATKRRRAGQKLKSPAERRKQSRYVSRCPQEITTVLDPFMSLPVEVSPDDRVLLQYYLSIGRRVILGTSERPKHDLALDMASRQMQRCPIHMLACINISEYIICVKNHMSRPPRLYQRIGRVYGLAKEILFRTDSPLQVRVSALLNLQMMESALDQKATQAVHLQALNHLISFEGGFPILLSKMGNNNPMIAPVDLLGQCMWGTGFQRDQRLAFEAAKTSLLDSLATIRGWFDKNSRVATSVSISGSRTTVSIEQDDTEGLSPLKTYLRSGIDSHLRRPKLGSLAHAPAMFNLLFSICFTFAWLDCQSRTATELLWKLQQSMQASVTEDSPLPRSLSGDGMDRLHVLHPNQVFSSFYHIRRGMTNSHPVRSNQDSFQIDGESHLCSISIDVAKLFSMISESIRIQLATELFHCIFHTIPNLNHNCFDRDELNQLNDQLESFWTNLA